MTIAEYKKALFIYTQFHETLNEYINELDESSETKKMLLFKLGQGKDIIESVLDNTFMHSVTGNK